MAHHSVLEQHRVVRGRQTQSQEDWKQKGKEAEPNSPQSRWLSERERHRPSIQVITGQLGLLKCVSVGVEVGEGVNTPH